MSDIHIRVPTKEDTQALLNIYAYYVENTAVTFEYEVPSVCEFGERIERTLKKYPYLAAEEDGKIIGYAYASAFKERPAYDRAVETSVYIDKSQRRKGVGKYLYSVLESALSLMGILNMNACIAYPEEEDEYLTRDSEKFHRCCGFKKVGKFHKCGYKFGRWYNMIWMEKHIGRHSENPPEIKSFQNVMKCASLRDIEE